MLCYVIRQLKLVGAESEVIGFKFSFANVVCKLQCDTCSECRPLAWTLWDNFHRDA